MENIKTIREKSGMPDEHELEDRFRTDFHYATGKLKTREDHLLELKMKLQETKSQVEMVEASVRTEKQRWSSKMEELNSCSEQVNELQTDKNNLLQEVQQLSTQRNGMKNAKPNLKDQQTLEQGTKKFKYYKQLTGVRWDFGAPKGTIKGYVTNGSDYVHSFNYKTHEIGSKLQNSLWNEIAKATGRLEPAENNENRVPNN